MEGPVHLGRQASSTIQSGVHRVLHDLACRPDGPVSPPALQSLPFFRPRNCELSGGLQEALREVAMRELDADGDGPKEETDASTDRSRIKPEISGSNSIFPNSVAASEMGLPLGGKPRSEVTGRHDPIIVTSTE
jgi:hypothetical protein